MARTSELVCESCHVHIASRYKLRRLCLIPLRLNAWVVACARLLSNGATGIAAKGLTGRPCVFRDRRHQEFGCRLCIRRVLN